MALAALLLVAVQMAYGKFGRGVEFFPNVEPDYGQVVVHGRGNLSLEEKDRLIAEVEKRVLEFAGPRHRLCPHRRAAARHGRDSPRTPSASSSSSSRTGRRGGRGTRSWTRSAQRTADIPGIQVEVTAPRAGPPTGKPIQVQLSRARSGGAAGGGAQGRGAARGARRHPRSRRRPAAARHRLDHPGRQGGGREIRRRRQHRRRRGAARHQRPQGDRIPPGRQRQGGRHPGALPARPAQPRPDRRAAHPDPVRARADRQFRRSACRRSASASSIASTATA